MQPPPSFRALTGAPGADYVGIENEELRIENDAHQAAFSIFNFQFSILNFTVTAWGHCTDARAGCQASMGTADAPPFGRGASARGMRIEEDRG
jgi:hypothetical protein